METVEIRSKLRTAIKENNTILKNVLRLLLGEIETLESSNKKFDSNKIIKKLIDSNNQILAIKNDEVLIKENEILNSFLPKEISKEELLNTIESFYCPNGSRQSLVLETNTKSEGQLMGIFIKQLKANNVIFNNNDLVNIIKELKENNA